ncbi:hypothetical protein [Dyella sp.]|uniref:hypothetical protein n=1 Tax=Dyella sp. TaxID=1869338 RepID=UPI00284271A2|nr:hypothetical protein [Dyella sp.]MDR3447600.1 hypothetical protein [Dyella sp.]
MAASSSRSPFMNWARRSLIGNIVLLELTLGPATFVVFCAKAYSDGDLSRGDLVFFAVLSAIGGLATGALFWFGLSRPLLARRKGPRGQ